MKMQNRNKGNLPSLDFTSRCTIVICHNFFI